MTIFHVITSQVQEIDLNDHVTCAEFHPTELMMAVGTEPGQVYMYNFSTMMLESFNPFKTDFGPLLGLAYADEGKFLFGIYPDSVRVVQTDREDTTGNYATAQWKKPYPTFAFLTPLWNHFYLFVPLKNGTYKF